MAPEQSLQMAVQRPRGSGATVTFTSYIVDPQIDDRSIAHVGPAARQPIREVAVAFEIVAPRLAPERRGDRAPFNLDRRCVTALLLEFRQFPRSLKPPNADRNVGSEAVVVHPHSSDAVWRSSETSFNSSASCSSVNST